MKISTKGRYGLRVMIDIASHSQDEYISLKDIAARLNITVKYLEQIVAPLNKAGFLTSMRGNSGGHKMAIAPKDCKVGDIIICCFTTRNCASPTISSDWTLLSVSNANSSDSEKQRLNWATKIATSTTESITVTQTASGRLYLNLVILPPTATIQDNGFTYFNSSTNSFTVSKPSGIVIWGASVSLWGSGFWTTSNAQQLIQLASNPRLLTSIDQTDFINVTFNSGASSTAVIGSLTITNI